MSDWPHDPLEELARELRQTIGAEFRAEAEVTEHETHIGRMRRLGLGDIAKTAMHRGDLISLITGTRTISGVPVFVGKDYLVCQTPREIVDAPFNRVIIRVEPRGSGGHTTRGGAVTFKARLAEFEQTNESVTVVSADASMEMSGAIAVVATDHCIVQAPEGTRFHFPIGQIALIIRPRPDV